MRLTTALHTGIVLLMKKQWTYRGTMLACYQGIISQAIINNLAPLLFVIFQDRFDISLERIGLLIMINFGTQLIVDALSVQFADKIGHRPLMVGAHIACALGLVFLSVLPNALPSPYLGLVLAVITYAIGGGLIEVLVSPIVDSLPGDAKTSAMSLLHSFYCWGHVAVVLLTTAMLALFGQGLWYILPLVWAIVPAANIFNFSKVPLAPQISEHERIPLRRLMTNKIFLLAILMMICSGASEQAMSQWASLFAEKGLQVSKTLGDLLGPCMFAVCMGIGRTLFGIWGEKIRLSRALAACAALCVACYLVTALSANPFVALVGCAVTGFSVSLMWPGMISLSARMFTTGGTALFALLALGGDLGCSVGPWLTGIVSGAAQNMQRVMQLGAEAGLDALQTGLKAGLLAAVIFPLALLAGIWAFRRRTDRAE